MPGDSRDDRIIAGYDGLGPFDSPGEQLLLDIVEQSGNTIIAMEIIAIDVVKAEE